MECIALRRPVEFVLDKWHLCDFGFLDVFPNFDAHFRALLVEAILDVAHGNVLPVQTGTGASRRNVPDDCVAVLQVYNFGAFPCGRALFEREAHAAFTHGFWAGQLLVDDLVAVEWGGGRFGSS